MDTVQSGEPLRDFEVKLLSHYEEEKELPLCLPKFDNMPLIVYNIDVLIHRHIA